MTDDTFAEDTAPEPVEETPEPVEEAASGGIQIIRVTSHPNDPNMVYIVAEAPKDAGFSAGPADITQ